MQKRLSLPGEGCKEQELGSGLPQEQPGVPSRAGQQREQTFYDTKDFLVFSRSLLLYVTFSATREHRLLKREKTKIKKMTNTKRQQRNRLYIKDFFICFLTAFWLGTGQR